MYEGVDISLPFQLSLLHGLLVLLLLLVLDVLVTVVEDTHAPMQNDVELVAIVALGEDEISLGKVFVPHFAADFSQMLVFDLPLLEEVVFFDIRDKLVKISFVSSLWVLFQDCHHNLQMIVKYYLPRAAVLGSA
jgi:hypothetical protein